MEFRSTVDSFSLVLQESDSYPLPSGTAFHGLEKKIGHFFLYRHEKALNQTEEKWNVQKSEMASRNPQLCTYVSEVSKKNLENQILLKTLTNNKIETIN